MKLLICDLFNFFSGTFNRPFLNLDDIDAQGTEEETAEETEEANQEEVEENNSAQVSRPYSVTHKEKDFEDD